jgi:hypothetical protein
MALPGVVSSVSKYGLFVQLADGVCGLVGLPELVGPAPPSNAPDEARGELSSEAQGKAAVLAALAQYHVGQSLTARVISVRGHGPDALIGLSLHTARLNPQLDGEAGLHAAAARSQPAARQEADASAEQSARGPRAETDFPCWGRVLSVSGETALISVELRRPYALHLSELQRPAQGPHASAPSELPSSGGPVPPSRSSLKAWLSVGQIIPVGAARTGGAVRLRLRGRVRAPIGAGGAAEVDAAPKGGGGGAAGLKRSWESESEDEAEDERGDGLADDEGAAVAEDEDEALGGERKRQRFLSCGV